MAALRRLLLGLMLVFAGALATPSPSIEPHSPIDIVVDTLAPQAQAITSSQRALLRRGISPVASWDASTGTLTSLAALVTATRTSNAMMFDSTGKLTYAPNNLLTYNSDLTNGAWTAVTMSVGSGVSDPVGGTGAFTLTATSANGNIRQSATGNASTNYLNSVWVRRRTGTGTVRLYQADNATYSVIAVTSSWQQFYVSGAGGASTAVWRIWLITSGDAIDVYLPTTSAVTYETTPRTADQVITTSAAYYGPRIDYMYSSIPGLLVEGARTNLAIQSRALSNAAWNKTNITIGSDTTLGVDGLTADLITTVGGVAEHLIYNVAGYVVVNGSTYTFTAFRKAGTGRYWQLGMQGTTGYVSGVFDLSLTADASAVQTSSSTQTLVSATAKYLGSGWHRLQVTLTVTSGTDAYFIESAANANGSNTFSYYGSVTNGPSGVTYYGSGNQAELGSYATSYIPTAASSVTRAADALAAAAYSSNPAIIQYRDQATGTRARKVINPWSGISSETAERMEIAKIYPVGTPTTYLNSHLTVDGAW